MSEQEGTGLQPEEGEELDFSNDPQVSGLAGTQGGADDEGGGEGDDAPKTVPFAAYAALAERLKQTNKAAGRTSENLHTTRTRVEELEAELAQLRGGGQHAPAQTGKRVQYNQTPETQDYFSEETFNQAMSQFDENWEANGQDPLYSGGLRALARMMFNGLGNLTARMEQLDRSTRIRDYGMTESQLEEALSIPGLQHLAHLEPDQIAEVINTFEEIASSRHPGPGPSTDNPQGGGAPRRVRRDPRHFQDARPMAGSGSIGPDQELAQEIEAHGGASKKARKLGAQMFLQRAALMRGHGG